MITGVDLSGVSLDASVRQCRACGACEVEGGEWRTQALPSPCLHSHARKAGKRPVLPVGTESLFLKS